MWWIIIVPLLLYFFWLSLTGDNTEYESHGPDTQDMFP